MQQELIQQINRQFDVSIPGDTSNDLLVQLLAARINELIMHDFSLLVHILYRMDVSENKLKKMLAENKNTDAAKIIAALVMERQLQKIKSRQENHREDNHINDEEKW
jgi:hypothetical protein